MTDALNTEVSTSVAPALEEKLLPQSQVNKIVGNVKQEAFEKGRQAAMQELQAQNQGYQDPYRPSIGGMAPAMQPQPMQQSIGGISQPTGATREEVEQIVAGRIEEIQNQARAQQVLNDFDGKLKAGKAKYSDFDEVVQPILDDFKTNGPVMGHLLWLVNSVDNSADVMYELGQNPYKLGSLIPLAHTAQNAARAEIVKLSNSIKNNQNALNQTHSVNEPLAQLKPSTVGKDSGSEHTLSVKELKRMAFNR